MDTPSAEPPATAPPTAAAVDFAQRFAAGWSLFAGVYILAITFVPIPKENIRFADTILGFVLGTLIATLINFFFGSSRMRKAQDDTMHELMAKIKKTLE